MHNQYDCLKLEKQLGFPLYACSKEVIKKYRPYLDELGLTYTQFITMLVMWEDGIHSVKELGGRLYLDSGTLTPVLKSLEAKGLVKRYRSLCDERVLLVELTAKGSEMKDVATHIPSLMDEVVKLSAEEKVQLCTLLEKVLAGLDDTGDTQEK